jgi:hypothetical protein
MCSVLVMCLSVAIAALAMALVHQVRVRRAWHLVAFKLLRRPPRSCHDEEDPAA